MASDPEAAAAEEEEVGEVDEVEAGAEGAAAGAGSAAVDVEQEQQAARRGPALRLCEESLAHGAWCILHNTEALAAGGSYAELEDKLTCSSTQALFSLFQFYCAFGHDKGVLEDRVELHLYDFEKFARDIGLLGESLGHGDVILAFERQTRPGKAKVIGFEGFVRAMLELSFLKYAADWYRPGDASGQVQRGKQRGTVTATATAVMRCFQAFLQELVLARGISAWRAASREQEQRCVVVDLPQESLERGETLPEDIFRFYTEDARGRMSFERFLSFCKDFELFPKLCTRRAVARGFRSAFVVSPAGAAGAASRAEEKTTTPSRRSGAPSSAATLSRSMFRPCLVVLAQEIFNHDYVEAELRSPETSYAQLLDLLRSCDAMMYKVAAARKRRAKARQLQLRGRRRPRPSAPPCGPEEKEEPSPSPSPSPSEAASLATTPGPATATAPGKTGEGESSPTTALSQQLEALSCDMRSFISPRARRRGKSPPGVARHVTIHPNGTIDVVRLQASPRTRQRKADAAR